MPSHDATRCKYKSELSVSFRFATNGFTVTQNGIEKHCLLLRFEVRLKLYFHETVVQHRVFDKMGATDLRVQVPF